MKKLILLILLVLRITFVFSQERNNNDEVFDERLGQKNILVSGDSLYQPLYDFIIKNSQIVIYDKVQIRYSNLVGCEACTYGIIKFERLATGQEVFLFFKNRDGQIYIIDNYTIEDILMKAFNFFKENNYSYESQCLTIKSIMDFLLEKKGYMPDKSLPIIEKSQK